MGKTVDKPYAGGRWSRAKLFSFIRSSLRRASVRWPVKADVMRAARRKNQSDNKRLKWQYRCDGCGEWFAGKDIEVDHVVPCGTLRSFSDLPGFCERLFVEREGYAVLCKATCHAEKTRRDKAQSART